MIAAYNPKKVPLGKLYWRGWLAVILFALLLRVTVFFGPWGDGIGLFTGYAVSTWISLMVLFLIERYRFLAYLERHHPEKWAELTGMREDGTYGFVGFRPIKWLSTMHPTGDPVLEQMKYDRKQLMILALCVFTSVPLMFALLLYAPVQ